MPRSLTVFPIILMLFAGTAPGQDANAARGPLFDVRVQLGFLPLSDDVGSVSTWLHSVGVGYWLPVGNRRTMIEASVAHVGQDRDPSNRAPAFTFFGLLVHGSLREPTAQGLQPVLLLGIGRMRVDVEEVICEPPCLRESALAFVDGTFTTGVAGTGVLVPVTARAALRGDLRLFMPLNASVSDGDSGKLRSEFAAGIVLRL